MKLSINAKKKLKLPEQPTKKDLSPMKEKIAEMIYIDPEKQKKPNANYDENGRPIKTE